MKYTKRIIQEAVKKNKSVMGVLRHLGISEASGSMHAHISRQIKKFEIDTSHFTGLKTNCGPNHKGGNEKRTADEILIKREEGQRHKTYQLRRALLEVGRRHECAACGIGPEWNGKPLTLQIEHRNGDNIDDREENLDFYCPNCHSQTPHYSKIRTRAEKNRCKRCGKGIWRASKSGYCHTCLWHVRSKAGVAEQADAQR